MFGVHCLAMPRFHPTFEAIQDTRALSLCGQPTSIPTDQHLMRHIYQLDRGVAIDITNAVRVML